MKIKLVAIKKEFFDIFDFKTEFMLNAHNAKDRPCLIILKLSYKGKKHSFALPFRSNIQVNKNTEGTYFPLPKRSTTKDNHAHGLHYIKMFPIDLKYCNKYVPPETKYDDKLIEFIEKNINKIIEGSKKYLSKYENDERENFCTDIDRLLEAINKYELSKQQTTTSSKITISSETTIIEKN